MKVVVAIFFFSLLGSSTFGSFAFGQSLWTQTSGPQGGLTTAVTADSGNRIFIGTAFGGVFESSNQGTTWYSRNTGLTNLHIKNLESSTTGYVYAVTYDGGTFRYLRDDRPTWEHLPAADTLNTILCLVAAPNGHVFGGTGGRGIVRSKDDGETWQTVDSGLMATASLQIPFMTVSPEGRLLMVAQNGHIFSSENDGDTWQEIPRPPSIGKPSAILLTNDKSIYYCDDKGLVYKSTNNGEAWTISYTDPGGFGSFNIVQSQLNSHLFLRNFDGVLIRSVDEGSSWQRVDSVASGGDFYPVAIDRNGFYYHGTDFEGMFRSKDDGESFELINDNLIANLTLAVATDKQHNVYALTEDFAWRSTDRGDTWLRLPFEVGETFENPSFAIDSSGYLYIGAAEGLYHSYNGGMDWTVGVDIPEGAGANQIFSIAVSQAGSIFAGTQYGLELSHDHGQSWKLISDVPQTKIKSVIIGANGAVYVGADVGAIYRTTDDGYNWDAIGIAIGLAAVDADGRFYKMDNHELLRSDDSFNSWILLAPRDLASAHAVFDVMVDKQGQIVASTDSGVFVSKDHGDTWRSVGEGLQDASASRLSFVTMTCEDNNGTYYAASRGQGVFRSVPFLTADVAESVRPYSNKTLGANYPNPFVQSTTIPFTLGDASATQITVTDPTGRTVWSSSFPYLSAGRHSVQVTLPEPSGVYFYTLSTNSGSETRQMSIVR